MFFVRVLIVLTAVFAAAAATAQTAQDRTLGENACGRDASRVCKKVINDGDMAVLNCLKENRTRLRPVCVKHLQANGQL
jgi:Cysteine rich repeat